MSGDAAAAKSVLNAFTSRQRDVMDRVLLHHTSKEIARDLGIAPNTVDQRINAVRAKLGAKDRAETARLYANLKVICGETTCGLPVLDDVRVPSLARGQDAEIAPVFALSDSATSQRPPWSEIGELVVPRARVADSKLRRIAMIVIIAVGIVVVSTLVLAVMHALNGLL